MTQQQFNMYFKSNDRPEIFEPIVKIGAVEGRLAYSESHGMYYFLSNKLTGAGTCKPLQALNMKTYNYSYSYGFFSGIKIITRMVDIAVINFNKLKII